MSAVRSRPFTFAPLVLGAALLALAACDEPTPITPQSARDRSTVSVGGTGSTGSGVVTASAGEINCTLEVSADGDVHHGEQCAGQYRGGTHVTLTASPTNGSTFEGWISDPAGACEPNREEANVCDVRVKGPVTVNARFAAASGTYVLTVNVGGQGTGTVTSSPSGITCKPGSLTGCSASFASGASVKLTATAVSGSYIGSWSGCSSPTGVGTSTGTCSVTMSGAKSVSTGFNTNASVATLGRWDPPASWPIVAIHASLMPDGSVVAFSRAAGGNPAIWFPSTKTFQRLSQPVDLFCSGHSLLSDGRLLIAGGHMGKLDYGIRATTIYSHSTRTFTTGTPMRNGRWYPTNTTLPNGSVLTVSGGDTTAARNLVPEIWSPKTGSWRRLTTASKYLEYYPWMFVAPNGRVFAAGPTTATYYLDTASTGKWISGPTSRGGLRDYGSAVMYESGKILIVGGKLTPTATAEVVDLNAGTAAAWRYVASMSVARRQLNATLLPDGKVLVTGGTNASGFNTKPTSDAVLAAERWDPATEKWTKLARMTRYRLYHSLALLLPDGRVLVAGSGHGYATGLTNEYSAELYSPPYLFTSTGGLATRPTISSAPTSVTYNATFTVGTTSAASIGKVTLIRLPSVTHSFDMNQRFISLEFSKGTGSLSVTAPANRNVAPPGHYMLFIVNTSGVPSVAKIIRVS